MLNRLYKQNKADVVFENFGDETVLINLKSGSYYSLNGPGSTIWELLLKKMSPLQILESIRQKYPENKNGYEDIFKEFITVLTTEGLVVPAGEHAQTVPGLAVDEFNRLLNHKEKAAGIPLIKIYTDQRELLLLDPIHEVSGLGWPEHDGIESHDE